MSCTCRTHSKNRPRSTRNRSTSVKSRRMRCETWHRLSPVLAPLSSALGTHRSVPGGSDLFCECLKDVTAVRLCACVSAASILGLRQVRTDPKQPTPFQQSRGTFTWAFSLLPARTSHLLDCQGQCMLPRLCTDEGRYVRSSERTCRETCASWAPGSAGPSGPEARCP